ncbi:MAG TPA: isoprenylcysteine carboxylmethyltransferase family protein [Solirubrobacteraceae bacterium]|jgi:protein-S-isoprenylcysteine O-methyltransferase Ste14
MVAVVVPALLAWLYPTEIGLGLPAPASALPVVAGVVLIAVGLRLWLETIRLFVRVGEGTLAPWDPPRRFVVRGPYRRVRNPMISALGFVLLGEAALLGSGAILILFAGFAIVNAIYIPLVEEPGLVRRFGGDYEEYRRAVRRWIPRRRPWSQGGGS